MPVAPAPNVLRNVNKCQTCALDMGPAQTVDGCGWKAVCLPQVWNGMVPRLGGAGRRLGLDGVAPYQVRIE